jgi:hypothetical protein
VKRTALIAVGLLLAPALRVAAQDAAPAPAAAVPSSQVVRQKETLVRSLLGDSPVSARISASQNADAKRLFATAQDGYHQAVIHLQTGDLARAEQFLNEAMWNIGRARQMVPDPNSRVIEDRVRYARLQESVEALRGSYARHVARGKTQTPGAAPRDRELERIDAMIEEAKASANSEKVGEAARLMEQAEKTLLVGINQVLGSATLEYAEKFDTPADEFAYEMERNRSFSDLVPVAIAELKPTADATRLVDRYVEQNRGMREQAQREAGSKNYTAALKSIRAGTSHLQRALLAAGLVMPKDAAAENSD